MTFFLAQTETTVPPELLGPLGLTVCLLLVVGFGTRYLIALIKEVMADLRNQRDEAQKRARESDALARDMADANRELVDEVRQIADSLREGRLEITGRRSGPRSGTRG